MIDRKEVTILVAAYVICGFLAFGYCWNHRWQEWHDAVPPRSIPVPQAVANAKMMASSAFWPIYWAGKLTIRVTQ